MNLELSFIDDMKSGRGNLPAHEARFDDFHANAQTAIRIVGSASFKDMFGDSATIHPPKAIPGTLHEMPADQESVPVTAG